MARLEIYECDYCNNNFTPKKMKRQYLEIKTISGKYISGKEVDICADCAESKTLAEIENRLIN